MEKFDGTVVWKRFNAARELIIELHTERLIDSEYSTLRDAIDSAEFLLSAIEWRDIAIEWLERDKVGLQRSINEAANDVNRLENEVGRLMLSQCSFMECVNRREGRLT